MDVCKQREKKKCGKLHDIFSSPELKAQVSFTDHPLSVVCLAVCLLNNYIFLLLLQNCWANFNQTWHKASLDKGDSELYK
jgi:hypothetical protein